MQAPSCGVGDLNHTTSFQTLDLQSARTGSFLRDECPEIVFQRRSACAFKPIRVPCTLTAPELHHFTHDRSANLLKPIRVSVCARRVFSRPHRKVVLRDLSKSLLRQRDRLRDTNRIDYRWILLSGFPGFLLLLSPFRIWRWLALLPVIRNPVARRRRCEAERWSGSLTPTMLRFVPREMIARET